MSYSAYYHTWHYSEEENDKVKVTAELVEDIKCVRIQFGEFPDGDISIWMSLSQFQRLAEEFKKIEYKILHPEEKHEEIEEKKEELDAQDNNRDNQAQESAV